MVYILAAVLPITAFIVLNKKIFSDKRDETFDENVSKKTFLIAGLAALIIGTYDGFYGPGLMLKNGTKIVRPAIILVLILLLIKIIYENIF